MTNSVKRLVDAAKQLKAEVDSSVHMSYCDTIIIKAAIAAVEADTSEDPISAWTRGQQEMQRRQPYSNTYVPLRSYIPPQSCDRAPRPEGE